MKKILIAYFSRRGANYVGGRIVDLPVGNTEVVARKIRQLTGGDLFRIEPVKAYPDDYTECTRVAQQELRTNARPALKDRIAQTARYDIVFLGYPNWWNTVPMAVRTFLESHDFAGKTIVPFCTHEGNGAGRSAEDIRRSAPSATVLDATAIVGSTVARADARIEALVAAVASNIR